MKSFTLFAAMSLALCGCGDLLDLGADESAPTEPAAATPAKDGPAAKPRVDAPVQKAVRADTATPEVDEEPADDRGARKADADDEDVDDEPEADPDAELIVKRLVIADGVSGREPTGAASSFAAGKERIYAFVEVGNKDHVASEISVSFYQDGKRERGGITLKVGAAPRWRTWSYTRLAKTPGTWHAVVRDGKGKELARKSFEITGSNEPTEVVDKPAAVTDKKVDAPTKDDAPIELSKPAKAAPDEKKDDASEAPPQI